MKWMTTLAAVVVLAHGAFSAEITYPLNGDNTRIEWTGSKPEGKHTGGFKTLSGTAQLGEGTGLKIDVEIECASLYSDNPKLTGHLLSPDFFAVKDFPKARFVSKKVEKSDAGFVVTGDLTLLGKTREVRFPAEIAVGDTLTLNSAFKINRLDFGMGYGKGKINDEVELRVKVSAKK